MKRNIFLAALALACALSVVTFKTGAAPVSNSIDNPGIAIGSVVPDFTLQDINGKNQSLASLKGRNGAVLIFISVQCPVSNAYNERMAQLFEDYKARGVNVIGINSNVTEDTAAIRAHAAAKGLNFTILKDKDNKIADRLKASVTPEAFVIDAAGKLVYQGRIDDSRSGATISANDLRNALEAILSGKPVEKAQVRAFGCSIKRVS